MSDVLVISNYDVGDESFESDVGSWNITRAMRDCAAGKHELHSFDVDETLANNDKVDVDEAKVAGMVADLQRLLQSPPLIFCMEHGKIWLIEGHHRLRALARLGQKRFAAYVIEEADAKPYRMFFNGDRRPPWMRK